jgi:N-acetylneuraminic acid mutarotase
MTARAQVPYGPDHFGLSDGLHGNLDGTSGARMLAKLSPNQGPTVRSAEISLDDRVAYQRAIEEVYWRHRVWPKERPDHKPSLDEVLPPAQIRQKVLDYLRNSQALADYWQQPVRPEQLQAEMERMAHHTQQPEVLRELFEALGKDPFVIAECLARPALSDRMLTNLYAYDERFHGELKQRAETELRLHRSLQEMKHTSGTYSEVELIGSDNEESRDAGSGMKMSSREWDANVQRLAGIIRGDRNGRAQPMAGGGSAREPQVETGVLSPLQEDESRYYAIAVVEKTKNRLKLAMVEWRKEPLESWRARVGDLLPAVMAAANWNYTLPTISDSQEGCPDNWVTSTSLNIPTGRESHAVVWTGSEMIIWGGYGGDLAGFNSGGRYNPSTGTWTNTSTTNTPSKRIAPKAVWTGSEMIVWGGTDIFGPSNTGGKYDPGSDSWTAMTNTNAPSGRGGQTAVWTGSEMIVWGGTDGHVFLNTGGRYNPTADIWTTTSTTDAPTGRDGHTAVWTGSEMIIWGGRDGSISAANTGGKYNPFTNGWTPTSTDGAPTARSAHSAVWTGSEMIIWGGWGQYFSPYFNTGSRYDPATNGWTAINSDAAPSARNAHSAVWSGTEMIVWGGRGELGYVNTGGRYNLQTNSWTPTSISNASLPRWLQTAVWTGTEMIVWGGEGDGSPIGFLSTGARYNPTTDSWVPTGNAPAGRQLHSVAWTGTEMIAWAGFDGFGNSNTGGKYNPTTDAWTATSTTNAPDPRRLQASVWTGTEMIVWGGFVEYMGAVNTGGKYNPDTNGWTTISTANAPVARTAHTAVWSGSEMIVWGGCDSSGVPFDTGGRYNPLTNSWTVTNTANAPTARVRHTAVWTGDEMVIWGGTPDGSNYLNTGGKYNSVTDTWATTSNSNAPSPRFVHTAVWTGSEMIVWGGFDGFVRFNTGGRYNPGTDTWTTTSTVNAPFGREGHTAVWSDSEMIIWGGEDYVDWLNDGGRYNPGTDSWIATVANDSAPIGRILPSAVWTGSKMIVWAGTGQFGYLNSGGIYCAQPAPPTPSPTPRPATLGNISTRLQVGTGANVAIAGFIVQGSAAKRVLIRAGGPSLAQSGVPNPLANPRLELHQAANTIGLNDNWQTTQIGGVITSDQVAEIQNSGLAPHDPLESALIATLAPGSYTAIVQGVNGGTGIGLVEVYDLEATSGSRLANISTRGFVQTGDNAMIGGFIVVTQPTTVIIRAIGPSLTQFGVPDALANPQLELHDANNLIGQNDDWQTTQIGGIITSDQVAQIQASQLAPSSAAESAIIATLQPGNYTAIVRGVNTTTGNALVEVYALQ